MLRLKRSDTFQKSKMAVLRESMVSSSGENVDSDASGKVATKKKLLE